MFNISNFLEKFSVIRDPNLDKEVVVRVINEMLHVEIQPSSVSFKSNKLFLAVHPTIKSILYMNKEALLLKIKEEIKDRPITDIC